MTKSKSSVENLRRTVTVDDVRLANRCLRGRIVLIDDDPEIVFALAALFDLEGYACEVYQSALDYLNMRALNRPHFPGPNCVLCDVKMPTMNGLELQRRIAELDDTPLLLMSGLSGAEEAVSAFRAGAIDFLIKPIEAEILLAAVTKALSVSAERLHLHERHSDIAQRIASLTRREHEVLQRVARGVINRDVAEQLGIALRTVKLYRQLGMEKLGISTVADLVRLADEGGL
jgi:FixJ family two-component response regulator